MSINKWSRELVGFTLNAFPAAATDASEEHPRVWQTPDMKGDVCFSYVSLKPSFCMETDVKLIEDELFDFNVPEEYLNIRCVQLHACV